MGHSAVYVDFVRSQIYIFLILEKNVSLFYRCPLTTAFSDLKDDAEGKDLNNVMWWGKHFLCFTEQHFKMFLKHQ